MSEISSLLKDRPQTPVNTSVYWVEYVIRHKGAKHLRSGAEHLNFWQYFLIDVIAVVVLAITSIIALFIFIVRKLVQLVLTKRKKPSPKRNEKTTKKGKQPSKQSGKLKQK